LGEASQVGWKPLVVETNLAVAQALRGVGKYEDAREALEEALYSAGTLGRDELALDAASALVSTVGDRLAKYEDGLRWNRVAQMFAGRLGRSDDLAAAQLAANLGTVYLTHGESDKALPLYEKALQIRRRILGDEHPDVALNLVSVGMAHHTHDEIKPAIEYYQRAIAILERTLGSEHPNLGTALNDLATAYNDLAQFDKALEVQLRAISIAQKALGPEHPTVARLLASIGATQVNRGDFAKARDTLTHALAVMEKALGPEHPDVAMTLMY